MSKTYVIGDIHGCFDEYMTLANKIGIKEEDLVISLGDIVDRGNKSVELFRYFKERKNAIVLMGNHERKHLRGILSYSQEIVKVQFGTEYDHFIQWVKTLPYYHETKDAIIVHAFFEHDLALSQQKENVLAGTTSGSKYLEAKYDEGKYWMDYYQGEKPIIYGHHVVGDAIKIMNNTYGIDTGACHGGMLTAIELPAFKVHQVRVEKDHWKEEQAKWQIPVLEAKDWGNMKIEQIQKQILKLGYKKDKEIQIFLSKLSDWLKELQGIAPQIKTRIEFLSKEYQVKFGEDFNREVAKFSYRAFIFKAQAGNLEVEDILKTLDTPTKILSLGEKLELHGLPYL